MRFFLNVIFLCTILLFATQVTSRADTLIDFNELSNFTPGDGSTYFDGYSANANGNGWTSGSATFNTTGPFNGGWSYSNVNDTTTAGFTNQFAAITGTGIDGAGNYALAYESTFTGIRPVVTFDGPSIVNNVQVTNTTYAKLSMENGDFTVTAFDTISPDYFTLTFAGFNGGVATGNVDFYLADHRFADPMMDYIIEDWTPVDLSGLGVIDSLELSFSGSQNDPMFGLNIPAYAALDNFSITAVPEPSSIAWMCVLSVSYLGYRRRKSVQAKTTLQDLS